MSKQWQLNHPGTGSDCLHFNSVNDNIQTIIELGNGWWLSMLSALFVMVTGISGDNNRPAIKN